MILGGVEWDFRFKFSGEDAAKQAARAVETLDQTIQSLEASSQAPGFEKYAGRARNLSRTLPAVVASLRELEAAIQAPGARAEEVAPKVEKFQAVFRSLFASIEKLHTEIHGIGIDPGDLSSFQILNQHLRESYSLASLLHKEVEEISKNPIGRAPGVAGDTDALLGAVKKLAGSGSGYDIVGSSIKGLTNEIKALGTTAQSVASTQDVDKLLGLHGAKFDTSGYLGLSSAIRDVGKELNNLRNAPHGGNIDTLLGGGGARTTHAQLPRGFDSWEALYNSVTKTDAAISQATRTIREDDKAQQSKAQTNQILTDSFQLASQAILAFLSQLGLDRIYEAIQEYTVLAGRVENLGTVLLNVGTNAGLSRGDILNLENQIKSLGITTSKARESLALLAQGEIDLAEGSKLARVAQDAAVIAGINSSEAFERIVQSIQRTNTWMLRNLGILINLNNVYREYAVTHGRVSTTLSTHEKQELLLQEVLRKGVAIQGTYESALADVYKQYTSLDRIVEEAHRALGEQYLPIWQVVVNTITFAAETYQKADPQIQAVTAALLASIPVMLSAITVIGGLAAAVTLLNAATGNWLPVIAAVAVALGGLGGTLTYLGAVTREQTRRRNELIASMEAEAASVIRLQHSYETLTKIKESADKRSISPEQRRAVRSALEDAAGLMAGKPGGAEKARKLLSVDAQDIEAALRAINAVSPFASQTHESYLKSLQEDLDLTKQMFEVLTSEAQEFRWEMFDKNNSFIGETTLEKLRKIYMEGGRGVFRGQTAVGEAGAEDRRIIEALDAQIQTTVNLMKQKEAIIKGAEETITAIQIQEFKRREKAQETAFNLALRTINQFNVAKKSLYDSEGVEIYTEFVSMLDNLSRQVMSVEDIQRLRTLEADKKIREMTRVAEQRADESGDEDTRQKIFSQLRADIAALQEQRDQDIIDLIEQRKQILKALDLAPKKLDLELLKQAQDLEKSQMTRAAELRGADKKLTELYAERVRLIRSKATADQAFLDATKALREQEEELLRLRGTGADTSAGEEDLRVRKQNLQKVMESEEKAHQERLTQIRHEAIQRRMEIEQELFDKADELANKLLEINEKIEKLKTDHARKAAEERAKIQAKEIRAAEEALNKLERATREALDRGIRAIEMWREFGKLLAKGHDPRGALALVAEKFKVPPVGVQKVEDFIKRMREILEARKAKIEEAEKKKKEADDLKHKKELEKQLAEAIKQRERIIKALEELQKLGIRGRAGEEDLLKDVRKAMNALEEIKGILGKRREDLEAKPKAPPPADVPPGTSRIPPEKLKELEDLDPFGSKPTTPSDTVPWTGPPLEAKTPKKSEDVVPWTGPPLEARAPKKETEESFLEDLDAIHGGSEKVAEKTEEAAEKTEEVAEKTEEVKEEVAEVKEGVDVVDKDLQDIIDLLKKLMPKEVLELEKLPTNKKIEELAKLLEALASGKIKIKPPEDLPLPPRRKFRPDTRRLEAEAKWYMEFEGKLYDLLDKFGKLEEKKEEVLEAPAPPVVKKREETASEKAEREAREERIKRRKEEQFKRETLEIYRKGASEALQSQAEEIHERRKKELKESVETQEWVDRIRRARERDFPEIDMRSWPVPSNPRGGVAPLHPSLSPYLMPRIDAATYSEMLNKAVVAQKQLKAVIMMQSGSLNSGFEQIASTFNTVTRHLLSDHRKLADQVKLIQEQRDAFDTQFTSYGLEG